MPYSTKILDSAGKAIDYTLEFGIFAGENSKYVEIHTEEGRRIGRMTYSTDSKNRDHLFIYRMNNFTIDDAHPLKNIGALLLEIAIKKSLEINHGGRVELESIEGSTASFYHMGFRIKSKNSDQLSEQITDYRNATTDGDKEKAWSSLQQESRYPKLETDAAAVLNSKEKLSRDQIIEFGYYDIERNRDFEKWLLEQGERSKKTTEEDHKVMYQKLGNDKLPMYLSQATIQQLLEKYQSSEKENQTTEPLDAAKTPLDRPSKKVDVRFFDPSALEESHGHKEPAKNTQDLQERKTRKK